MAVDGGFEKVGVREARQLVEREGAALIDVRPAALRAQGYLAGSVSLPLPALTEETAAATVPDKGAPVVVYCQAGYLSELAAQALASYGYERVYDAGGIGMWPEEMIVR